MVDFDPLGPSMYKYRNNPLFMGIAKEQDQLYLRAAKLATESDCPLIISQQLEDIVLSHAKVKQKSCSPNCQTIIWRFEVPINDGKLPDTLYDAEIVSKHIGQTDYEIYDKTRDRFMEIMREKLGEVTYEEAIEYIKENAVQIPLRADRVKTPAPRVTEYYQDNVLQARVTNRCGLWYIDKGDKQMDEVREVYEWAKKRGLNGLQVFDREEPILFVLTQVDDSQLKRKQFRRQTRISDN